MHIHARPAGLRRSLWLIVTIALVVPATSPAVAQREADQPDRQQADSLSRKLAAMVQYAQAPGTTAQQTPVTEGELNAFLRLVAADSLPVGVVEPAVRMLGDGGVEASAVVDLDAVRRAGPTGGWSHPRQWLSGRLPVQARGLLRAENGWARFELAGAEVSGIPLPKGLLQEIVTYYSRSPEFPSGVDLDAPFQLPARIREIRVNPREAVVLQR